MKRLLTFANHFALYLLVWLGWLVNGNVALCCCSQPQWVCYLKGLPSHKAFCKRQFVINWGGLKRDQLQESLLLIFMLSTSTPLPTLLKSKPSTWVICLSVTSLPDIKSWSNTNHRLEPFISIFAFWLLSWFKSTNISQWWELISFSCLFTYPVQTKKPVALFTLVYK